MAYTSITLLDDLARFLEPILPILKGILVIVIAYYLTVALCTVIAFVLATVAFCVDLRRRKL